MSHHLSKYFSRRGKRLGLRGLEFLESRVLLTALVGTYGMVEFGGDNTTDFGATVDRIVIDHSGNVTDTTSTSVGGGVLDVGEVEHVKLKSGAGDSFTGSASTGYFSGDGSLFGIAVSQTDSFDETGLNLGLKEGSGLDASALSGQYNTVLWGTDGGNVWTSGVAALDFDGGSQVNGNITSVAQGQDSGGAFDVGAVDENYSVASNGVLTIGDHSGGVISSDGSIAVWTDTSDTVSGEVALSVAVRQTTGHSDADLLGAYDMTAISGNPGGVHSSGVASFVFDGAGNYTANFTAEANGVPGEDVLPSGQISGTYTVSDTGQLTINGTAAEFIQSTGFINADGSFAALTDVAGDTANLQTGMSFLIKAPSVSASRLTIAQQPAASTVAGQTLAPVVVDITDASGHLDVSNHSNVTLTLTGNKTGATLGGTVTVAAVNGVATFGNLSLTTAGNYTLTASDSALTSATSKKFKIIPDAASSQLVLVHQPAAGTVGVQLSPTLTVDVEDAFGNIITTDHSSVTLGISDGPTIDTDGIANSSFETNSAWTTQSNDPDGRYSSAYDTAWSSDGSQSFELTRSAGETSAGSWTEISQTGVNLTGVSGILFDCSDTGIDSEPLQFLVDGNVVGQFINHGWPVGQQVDTTNPANWGHTATTDDIEIPFDTTFTGTHTLTIRSDENLSFDPLDPKIFRIDNIRTFTSEPDGSLTGTTTVTAKKGVATFSKVALSAAGTYTLSLSDASVQNNTPVQFTEVINKGTTTAAAPHPAASYTFGQTISLSTTFKSNAPASVPFTQMAEILDGGGNPLGAATIAANGAVKFNLATVNAGTAQIAAGTYSNCTVFYAGDDNHAAFTSGTFTLLIKPAATKTTLVASATQLISGQSLTLTATVDSTAVPSVPRTGTITFLDNGTAFGNVTLSGSTAPLTFIPTPGVHNYSVVYSDDANFLTSSATTKAVTDNLSPGVIAGDTFLLSDLAGTDDKDPPGLNMITISGSGKTATNEDLSFGGNVSSTYTYKQTSPTTATVVSTGTGGKVTLQFTFDTSSSGTVQLNYSSGATGTSTFVLFGSPIPANAPADIGGTILTLTAAAGSGALGATGTTVLSPVASGNSYTLVGTGGSSVNSFGTFSYNLVNPSIGSFMYSDSSVGTGRIFIAYTSLNAGVYYDITDAGDWQAGTFTRAVP